MGISCDEYLGAKRYKDSLAKIRADQLVALNQLKDTNAAVAEGVMPSVCLIGKSNGATTSAWTQSTYRYLAGLSAGNEPPEPACR